MDRAEDEQGCGKAVGAYRCGQRVKRARGIAAGKGGHLLVLCRACACAGFTIGPDLAALAVGKPPPDGEAA